MSWSPRFLPAERGGGLADCREAASRGGAEPQLDHAEPSGDADVPRAAQVSPAGDNQVTSSAALPEPKRKARSPPRV